MRKYTVAIQDEAGGEPATFTVSDLADYQALAEFLGTQMPEYRAAQKNADARFEAQAFDAALEEHRLVRDVIASELRPLRTFNENDFMLLCDSPDICPGEYAPIVMLHFADHLRRSYVLPIGDRLEAMRIGAGIVEIAKRLGKTVFGVEGVQDVFLFHGQQVTNSVVGRIESIVQVLVASGETISLRFTDLTLLDFRELIDDMIKASAEQKAEMMM